MCRVANHQTRLPRAISGLALNACRDGASKWPQVAPRKFRLNIRRKFFIQRVVTH